MPPFTALLVILILISLFNLIGALVAYHNLPKIKANERLWELFAAYLMILLSSDLLAVQLVRRMVTELDISYPVRGFIVGMAISFVLMFCYSLISKFFTNNKSHAHKHLTGGMSIVVFLILAIHEFVEGASIAELMFEVSVTSISITAPLFPVAVLALHELPEGLLLVTPFFIAKKIKFGIYATLINQLLFILSGVFVYRYILIYFAPSIAQEAVIRTLTAGGIFYLGFHELKNSFSHGGDLKLFYTDLRLRVLSLIALAGVLTSLYLVYDHTVEEKAGLISEIDCEQGIDLRDCIIH